MKSVVVTGCSSGIGLGISTVLTDKGIRVFGSVRKAEDGARVKDALGDLFTPLLFDVTDEEATARAAREVEDALGGERLFGLVNNAGIAPPGPLLHQPLDEVRHVLEVDIMGQLIATRAFAPLLGADENRTGDPGRIVMISSVSGKMTSPFVGAYAAAKHGLEGLSGSLRKELMIYGIDVILVGPGPVATKIWDKADEADLTPYLDTDYGSFVEPVRTYMTDLGRKGLPAEELGTLTHHILTTAKPKVRYPVVRNKLTDWIIPRLLPERFLDRLIAKEVGMTRK